MCPGGHEHRTFTHHRGLQELHHARRQPAPSRASAALNALISNFRVAKGYIYRYATGIGTAHPEAGYCLAASATGEPEPDLRGQGL